jgi:hypothetical protein
MVEERINKTNFKPVEVSKRKPGLIEDQIGVNKYMITIPVTIATKLGQTVAILYSDTDKSVAVQKSTSGAFRIRQVGKTRSRSIYCRGLIEAKKIKKGRYPVQWDEKDQMAIAKVG